MQDTNNFGICPMSIPAGGDTPLMMCQHDKCAWWDEDAGECVVKTLARNVGPLYSSQQKL